MDDSLQRAIISGKMSVAAHEKFQASINGLDLNVWHILPLESEVFPSEKGLWSVIFGINKNHPFKEENRNDYVQSFIDSGEIFEEEHNFFLYKPDISLVFSKNAKNTIEIRQKYVFFDKVKELENITCNTYGLGLKNIVDEVDVRTHIYKLKYIGYGSGRPKEDKLVEKPSLVKFL